MKILVIDDDQQFRSVLARSFTKRGYEALECGDPRDVSRYFEDQRPDYVVVDLKMPHVSGLDVISQVLHSAPRTKIVMLTGYGSIATAQEGIKRGAHYYLTKPCDADKILETFGDTPAKPNLKEPTLAQVEWEHINRVLFDCGGNITKASKMLGMDRRSLQRKLAKVPRVV